MWLRYFLVYRQNVHFNQSRPVGGCIDKHKFLCQIELRQQFYLDTAGLHQMAAVRQSEAVKALWETSACYLAGPSTSTSHVHRIARDVPVHIYMQRRAVCCLSLFVDFCYKPKIMSLNQLAGDSTIRVYGPKIPSPRVGYAWILLYVRDLSTPTTSVETSIIGAEGNLLQAYQEFTGGTLAPELLWPLIQLNDSFPIGQEDLSLLENILRKCHTDCRVTCLLPRALWGLVPQIYALGAQECTPTAQSLASNEDDRDLTSKEISSNPDMSLLYSSSLWKWIEVLGGSKRTKISVFTGDKERPLEHLVRGMNYLATQHATEIVASEKWIKDTVFWKFCEPGRHAEEDEDPELQQDTTMNAGPRPRSITLPLPQTRNYTHRSTVSADYASSRESTPRSCIPRNMPPTNLKCRSEAQQ